MLLITKGTIVTEDNSFVGDILCNEGKIVKILPEGGYPQASLPLHRDKKLTPEELKAVGSNIVDARGKIVLPGGIDPHVHFHYPQGCCKIYSADDFFTGSYAAVCGGTTSYIDFVEALPDETLNHALEARNDDAKTNSVCDYTFHMSFNKTDAKTFEEVPEIVKKGITSFKIYTAYDGIRLTDEQMLDAFESLKQNGAMPIVHCENHALIMHRVDEYKKMFEETKEPVHPKYHRLTRPVEGEVEATHRVILLAESVGVPAGVHIAHVTAERAVPVLTSKYSIPVTGEVTCQHLTINKSVCEQDSFEEVAKFVCAPPMRNQEDCEAMQKALEDGAVNFVITDHCPFTVQQRLGKRRTPEFRWDYKAHKKVESAPEDPWFKPEGKAMLPSFFNMPGGVPAVENRMVVTYDQMVVKDKVSLSEFSKYTATNAAKRYGLYPQKGAIMEGSDADFCILSNEKQTIHAANLHQNVDYTIFEGKEVTGKVTEVVLNGTLVVKDGEPLPVLADLKGKGRLMPTNVSEGAKWFKKN